MPALRRLRPLLCLLLVALLPGLTGATPAPPVALTHDAYVWQRQWTPALRAALDAAAPDVAAWRVLAAETTTGGALRRFAPDAPALAATGRPAIAVVRIDGQLARWEPERLVEGIAATLADWRAAGLDPAGLEIDHDAGTARLGAYADFLGRLRAALPPGLPLSITALPAWLGSPALPRLLARADMAVLQVHAVEDPRRGLIDPAQARRWAAAFAAVTDRPFRIALPTYGSRVAWRADGRVAAIESERPTLAGGSAAEELAADPDALAGLVRDLARDAPRGLAGVSWFRLPTGEDRRAWRPATWRAVMQGRLAPADLAAVTLPGDDVALRRIALVNRGGADAALPARIDLPAGCDLADGIGAYRLARDAAGLSLRRIEGGLLAAGQARPVGWMRCAAGIEEAPHVAP